jgi:3-hydroxybutyryl-CoA dehydratase
MKAFDRSLGPLALEQIVRFSGAVQDFNPIHYDDAFAKAAGLPGVIAQGPLTYLLALDALVAANGVERIGSFAVRLKAPVQPGMSLAVSCSEDGKVSLKAGEAEALSGTATDAEGSPR